MGHDRLFDVRAGHSTKVNQLSAIEEIAWRTYIHAADDFGVMPFEAVELQRTHQRLMAPRLSRSTVQRMLQHILDVGLVRLFTHQGRAFCYQHDWQNYQRIRYPIGTTHPRIPAELLAACTIETQWLHTVWPGGTRDLRLPTWRQPKGWQPPVWSATGSATVADPLRNGCAPRAVHLQPEPDPELGGAGGNGSSDHDADPLPSTVSADIRDRAARFVERYGELYARFRHGAVYRNKPSLDFVEALTLVGAWDDGRLEMLVEAFLTTNDPFCRNGAGTIAHFRSRASWCDAMLRKAGL